MFGFIATDAAIPAPVLSRALKREAVGPTFNSITVDGDTSTNDTVALLANGAVRRARRSPAARIIEKFFEALHAVCKSLALAIVADGEGAQRVIEIEVRGAPSDRAADQIARTIANSPLVKTALAGADPNWGRILAAAGRSGVKFDFERVDIWLAGIEVCRGGREYPFDEIVDARKDAREIRAYRGRSACGRGKGAHVDLRLHQGIHPHQRQLPDVVCRGASLFALPCLRAAGFTSSLICKSAVDCRCEFAARCCLSCWSARFSRSSRRIADCPRPRSCFFSLAVACHSTSGAQGEGR